MNDALKIFTIYWDPSDYPGWFVTRAMTVKSGTREVSLYAHLSKTLEEARAYVQSMLPGAYGSDRHPLDDPCIVETWM